MLETESIAGDLVPVPTDETPASDHFFALTPERVLQAVEQAGLACNAVCYPLNSFENRVYEVELVDRSRIVAKFYRPSRWSEQQILEEHAFLGQLAAEEIPVCNVRPFPDGATVRRTHGIYYSLWDRHGGRAPDELDSAAAQRLGMFVGRMHAVGARQPFAHRPRLDADRYVRTAAEWMRQQRVIPKQFERRYLQAAEGIAEIADRQLAGVETLRIHADLHLGNVLFRDQALWVLDFDDAVDGPAVQDLWLALPGRDRHTENLRWDFIEGYERFRLFDAKSLDLIEVLRGLRLVRYCGWLARRWDDPAFRLGWPQFGSDDYWQNETAGLEEQLQVIRGAASRSAEPTTPSQVSEPESELTNKDFFWDWEGD